MGQFRSKPQPTESRGVLEDKEKSAKLSSIAKIEENEDERIEKIDITVDRKPPSSVIEIEQEEEQQTYEEMLEQKIRSAMINNPPGTMDRWSQVVDSYDVSK